MMKNKKIILFFICITFCSGTIKAQGEGENVEHIVFEAERNTTPAYRITSSPSIIDTIIPVPQFSYPLLTKSMRTSIYVEDIKPSKIKVTPKLEKLYPGYMKLGLGNYIMPMGELYYNAKRNRKTNYGIHLNHLSSFGKLKGYAPSQFDHTTGKVFGEFTIPDHSLKTSFNYLNHGYHYYGVENDTLSKDSLKNRVSAYHGRIQLANTPSRDSAKLLYKFDVDYRFFHEFNQDTIKESSLHARENNFGIRGAFKYKYEDNLFGVDLDLLVNRYKYGENDTLLLSDYKRNTRNSIFSLKPTITTYKFKNKLKVEVGLDLNFDINAKQAFKPLVIANVQYDLLKGILIPYAGIDGDLHQNSFYSINRTNEFINSSIELKNTKEVFMYGGIKGSFSKSISYNAMIFSGFYTDQVLFVNDTLFSDKYKFNVVYDKVIATGIKGSITYQKAEKLKVDAYTELKRYVTDNEKYAWNLPELVVGLRGSYNLYNKIILKADVRMEGGRKSPEGLFVLSPEEGENYKLGFFTDFNLQAEYRYNKRLSAFIQFNNLISQKYKRWYNYPVQGFQILGGITFGF